MNQIIAALDEARGHLGEMDETRETRAARAAINRASARAQRIAAAEAAALGEMPAGEHVGED